MVSEGGGSIVKGSEVDVPPPGAGVKTVTGTVPTVARSVAAIVACSVPVSSVVVGRFAPFQRTTERALNPLPFTVMVTAVPIRAWLGDRDTACGAGLVTGVSDARAWKIRIRGVVTPWPKMNRVSVIGNPVCCKAFSPVLTVMEGTACLSRANAPATCGADIDVPLSSAYPPPGTDELIDSPGASSDRKGAMLEKNDTSSDRLLEPT